MVIPTIHTDGCPAVMIILAYLSLLSLIILTLYNRRIRIKFWWLVFSPSLSSFSTIAEAESSSGDLFVFSPSLSSPSTIAEAESSFGYLFVFSPSLSSPSSTVESESSSGGWSSLPHYLHPL